jgi:hypothetical protein
MKRYRPYYFNPWNQTGHDAEMRQNPTGEWVRFEDHKSELARLMPLKGGVPVREWALQEKLKLAEEGLANYEKENERLRWELATFHNIDDVVEIRRLREELEDAINLLYECRDHLAVSDAPGAQELYEKVWKWCQGKQGAEPRGTQT